MSKRLFTLLALLLGSVATVPSEAGPGGCTDAPVLEWMGFEEIDVSSTAKNFTSTVAWPDGVTPAVLAVCFVEDDAVRIRTGLAPTATVGQTIAVNTYFTVCGTQNIKTTRMIRVTADADVTCQYYREGDQ